MRPAAAAAATAAAAAPAAFDPVPAAVFPLPPVAAPAAPVADVPVAFPPGAGPAPATAAAVPNAESAEFSRECEIEGLLLPVDGGLKKESGKLRMRSGTCSGRFESGFRTLSNSACRSDSEF